MALRHALVSEQQGTVLLLHGETIRPDASAMKIEHWRCQAHYCGEQLDYRNLLGACVGGDGQPLRSQHCDTRKGNDDLRLEPR